MKKTILIVFAVLLMVLAACGDTSDAPKEIDTIVFADAGWESIRVHNGIAQQIIENGYGYETDVTMGSTAATFQGLTTGDINVYMETWIDNIKEPYEEAIEKEQIVRLSTNFNDNAQGLYVPAYVIEGDPERDIEPLAPDLRTVEDLKKYPEVFKDPEDRNKGRLINAPSGWSAEGIINDKFETYGLDDTINNFKPGSDSAIIASLVDAYNKGEAWVGYYWSPTSITAKYDLILLEEPAYDEDIWNETRGTEFPPNDVVVAVHEDFIEQAPEVVEFLENYETNSELTEAALQYMEDNDVSEAEAAIWWMKEYEDIWTKWVPEDIAAKVKAEL